MILIADSGSSKTHWKLKTDDGMKDFYCLGINPFFASENFVFSELDKSGLSQYKNQVHEIIFYGSGCSSADRKQYITHIFQSYFTHAKNIIVDHDLKAACIALFGNNPGIACIIGTGSNSCVWDGKEITANVPALGYILGDEASGSYIGKEILKHYIYHTLPEEISRFIHVEYQVDKEDIFNAVYKSELPNRYLASYAKVASAFKSNAFIQEIIHRGFQEFVQYHIACYPESNHLSIGAIGSIADVFRDEFEVELSKLNLKLDILVKDPIENIVHYHLR
jgi:N-acetylglucosamine kinase-like BadF-type ATPase